ncbi:MAG: preprotein translocase subunit SecG [Alphaproteobacteria bacterium]|jgi:preprotein translocase subunit SecG
MEKIVLVIHLLLAIGLVGVVLAQRSESGLGSLGGGGGGGGGGGLLGNRATANLLTRTTAVLATCFMLTSIALAILAGGSSTVRPIVEETPAASESPALPSVPAVPSGPTVPQSQ